MIFGFDGCVSMIAPVDDSRILFEPNADNALLQVLHLALAKHGSVCVVCVVCV